MELFIGGRAQGKLEFVLEERKDEETRVFDGTVPEAAENGKTIIINNLHNFVRKELEKNGDPEKKINGLLSGTDRCVIIGDEIGNGIVPEDRFEREYRERYGRILIWLAKRADRVVRVICGIGRTIK